MPQTRTCPSGHEWDGDPADCPGCAGVDDSWNESAASTFSSDVRDELPPPPSHARQPVRTAAPVMAAAVGSGKLPSVPGYDVLGELGRGGMGIVYRARHVALGRFVALKVVSAAATDPREAERFRAEAESVARLQHPHIVQVFEVGEADGRPYLSLELMEGGTLAQALGGTPLPARMAAKLTETLARAVQYAHERGVIHRDLKPGNILLQSPWSAVPPVQSSVRLGTADQGPGTPKVADFGLAKRIGADSSQTTTGVVVGTPSYMAPEQAAGLGKLVGPACDVYALGAILYEVLTGRPPFRGSSSVETMQQVMEDDPVAPGRLQPRLPRDLDTICLKCLEKEPRKRFATAGELADDLCRFLDGRPILARRTTAWERAAKWARRRPAAAGLIAVSVLAAIGLAGLGYRYTRSIERHNKELTGLNETIREERDDANRQRARAENSLLEAVEAVDGMLARMGLARVAGIPFIDKARAALLEDALGVCDRLRAAQSDDPRLRYFRAHLTLRSADILGALGRTAEAEGRYGEAHDFVRGLREAPGVATDALDRLESWAHDGRGRLYLGAGEVTRAATEQETALAIREKLLAANLNDPVSQLDAAIGYVNRSIAAQAEGDRERQALCVTRALALTGKLAAAEPDTREIAAVHAFVLNARGVFLLNDREYDQAVSHLEKCIVLWRRLHKDDPGNLEYAAGLARGLSNLAAVWRVQGYQKRATELAEESLVLRDNLARLHPDVPEFAYELALGYYQAGELALARREPTAAAGWYNRAIDRVGDPGKDGRRRDLLRNAYQSRSLVRQMSKRTEDAADDLDRAAGFATGADRAALHAERAIVWAKGGQPAKAVVAAEAALAESAATPETRFDAARALAAAAGAETDLDRAARHANRAVAELARLTADRFFRDPAPRRLLTDSPDFKSLHERHDFKALLARIQSQ